MRILIALFVMAVPAFGQTINIYQSAEPRCNGPECQRPPVTRYLTLQPPPIVYAPPVYYSPPAVTYYAAPVVRYRQVGPIRRGLRAVFCCGR